MKKLFVLAGIAFCTISSFAQEGIHIGVKGGPQYTFMLNSDISDAQEIGFIGTWASAVGVSTNYHFTETIGVGFDLMFSNINQKYEFYESAPSDYSAILEAKYMRIPVLLHFNSDPSSAVMFKGFFGPQFGILNGATFTNTYKKGTGATGKDPKEITDGTTGVTTTVVDPARIASDGNYDASSETNYPGVASNGDVKNHFNGTTIGLALGLGFAVNFTDYLNMNVGLNIGYDFTDSGAQNIWTPTDLVNSDSDFLGGDKSATLSPTNNITGGIEFGLNYIIK